MNKDKSSKTKNRMDDIWFVLKEKGFFQGYKTPDDYRKAKERKNNSLLILDKN